MSPKLAEQLRFFALNSILVAGDIGITAERLADLARSQVDRSLSEPELATELRALADRGWIIRFTPPVGAERWRITALGRSTADEIGLG